MPRLINPVEWSVEATRPLDTCSPLLTLKNSKGHRFHVHPIKQGLIRVVHSLPCLTNQPKLKNHHRGVDVGIDGFVWEERQGDWSAEVKEETKQAIIESRNHLSSCRIRIHIDYSYTVKLSWYWDQDGQDTSVPFLSDFKSAYQFDARTQRVYHQVCREQSYLPLSEHALSANDNHISQEARFEYIYGLGESKGPMMKDGKRYLIDARDSLAADPQETDPLYKLCPFYLHYNRNTAFWYGLWYNTLSPSIFDFSGEHDFATGEFRSFSAESGPLEYYLLLGDDQESGKGEREAAGHPLLSSIVSQFARLVTPYSSGPCGHPKDKWQASPTLPCLSQFGYLASSLTLSERQDAQTAVIDYIKEARINDFPIDSMHLSSGYAVDSTTGERNYFTWDPVKYPDPAGLGQCLEKELNCKVIINVKPWLLETHNSYQTTASRFAFVRAAPDARPLSIGGRPVDEDRCGAFDSEPARTMHWSKGMGITGKGSYFDFSSTDGCREWQRLMSEGVLNKSITGFWIDNNEFSSLIDDEEELKGDIDLWSVPEVVKQQSEEGHHAAARMGWGGKSIALGRVGRAVLTMGMARATFEHLYTHSPNQRPVIVTRSAVPGMQAFAHATWSGDNSTTWMSLKWSTKLTLSVGLSFGMGLYGHDIGGFAGEHSPSSELLIRWCQQSMWHTRFTIHSWKTITTTPWMFGKRETEILRDTIHQRYRFIPMLYSLYITHYHRRGWPVLKPLLWYHSQDFHCLTQDEQFLVGSHLLVAPVCDANQRSTTFHLPGIVDDDLLTEACWFDLHTNQWHQPGRRGQTVTLDAPIECLPCLIRNGGILVLGPNVTSHLPSPAPSERVRTVKIFPTPSSVLQKQPEGQDNCHGSFVLVEDDGASNDAAERGSFTEITIYFHASKDCVHIGARVERKGYTGIWRLLFVLPEGDTRSLSIVEGATKETSSVEENADSADCKSEMILVRT